MRVYWLYGMKHGRIRQVGPICFARTEKTAKHVVSLGCVSINGYKYTSYRQGEIPDRTPYYSCDFTVKNVFRVDNKTIKCNFDGYEKCSTCIWSILHNKPRQLSMKDI